VASERCRAFYSALANGGIGLIVVEGGIFDRTPSERLPGSEGGFLSVADEKLLLSIRELTGLIHKHDCPAILQMMPIRNRIKLLKWLPEKGATLISGAKYEEITDKGLSITNREGERLSIKADTIVTAMPLKADTELLNSLAGKVPEIYNIGDCN
jgi:hypothetical protein